MSVLEFSDATFDQEVKQSAQPVLVDFWAPWCGPCRQVGPIVEEIAKDNDGKVKVGKVNVDDNPNSAASFGVMNIPTLLFFKGGNPVDKIVGSVAKQKIQEKLDSLL
jgi:thioredoxin 1